MSEKNNVVLTCDSAEQLHVRVMSGPEIRAWKPPFKEYFVESKRLPTSKEAIAWQTAFIERYGPEQGSIDPTLTCFTYGDTTAESWIPSMVRSSPAIRAFDCFSVVLPIIQKQTSKTETSINYN